MQLDVIVPTYNRCQLLDLALHSLRLAEVPSGLVVSVTVVDNNSTDQTRQVVSAHQPLFSGGLNYVFQPQQGKSRALNAGISATRGDLIGMVDDDEQVDRSWYCRIYEMFSSRRDIDFIGGPYTPRWGGPPPRWLPSEYSGVIGVVDGGPLHEFGTSSAELRGGNAVLRRSILQKVGPYAEELGPQGDHYLADEDTDMYRRLLAAGARGLYVPDLIIYHYIPAERLTKRYYRRWCFWRGVSRGMLDRKQPQPLPYVWGVPRHLVGKAIRGGLRLLGSAVRFHPNPAQRFSDELAIWDLAGFFYGRHWYAPTQKPH